MDKTKVVTFRLDEEELAQVDAIAKNHGYFSRSSVIMAGIKVMIEMEKRGLAMRALTFYPRWDEVIKLDFEIRRKVSV